MTTASQFIAFTKETVIATDTWEDILGSWAEAPGNTEPEIVLAEIVDTTRWSVVKRQVFKFPDGSYVECAWESPATEMQDQPPNTTWAEVEAVERTVIDYVRKGGQK